VFNVLSGLVRHVSRVVARDRRQSSLLAFQGETHRTAKIS